MSRQYQSARRHEPAVSGSSYARAKAISAAPLPFLRGLCERADESSLSIDDSKEDGKSMEDTKRKLHVAERRQITQRAKPASSTDS